MNKLHHYKLNIQWTGNRGQGTSGYQAYDRSHTIHADNKMILNCSADPAFRGDPTLYNPEDFLVASISTCHMLWYLHLCADAGIIVTDYIDRAEGTMEEVQDGKGKFTSVTLNPVVTITEASLIEKADALHAVANEKCFISNSVNFKIHHHPVCKTAGASLPSV